MASHDSTTAYQVFRQRFPSLPGCKLGHYAVLAAAGVNLSPRLYGLDAVALFPNEPLAKYLAFHASAERRQHVLLVLDLGRLMTAEAARITTWRVQLRLQPSCSAVSSTRATSLESERA